MEAERVRTCSEGGLLRNRGADGDREKIQEVLSCPGEGEILGKGDSSSDPEGSDRHARTRWPVGAPQKGKAHGTKMRSGVEGDPHQSPLMH